MANYSFFVEGVSVNAVFDKLGGVEGARRLLRGELALSEAIRSKPKKYGIIPRLLRGELTIFEAVRSWYEKDIVVRFQVTSDGTSGADWIKRLEDGGYNIDDFTKELLRSSDFKPTNGVTTEIVVMKDSPSFSRTGPTTFEIYAEATKRKYATPNPEVACLIREKFTDEEIEQMGLRRIVVMHKPIMDSNDHPALLWVERTGLGAQRYSGSHMFIWVVTEAYAFSVSAC